MSDSRGMWLARHANFTVLMIDAEMIVLKDLGPWDVHPTITNDAEFVVDQVCKLHPMVGRRLFYYDSENELTELFVEDGAFSGFGPTR